MLTKYDKAGGAVIGAALGTIIAYYYPMPMEVQGAVSLVLSGFLVWLFPNKET
ncbi:MAG: hypothetical protein ACR2RF_26080 [Geminicoccaceae bacterium]